VDKGDEKSVITPEGEADGKEGWYYRTQDGGHDLVKGPYSKAAIKELYSKGSIRPNGLIRYGLKGAWHPATTFFSSVFRKRMGIPWGHFILPVVFAVLLAVVLMRDSRTGLYPRPFAPGKQTFKGLPLLTPESVRPLTLPMPLQDQRGANEGLTREGILMWTNEARIEEMAPPLKENQQLNIIAAERVNDMFHRQYFAHVSPSGEGLIEVALKIGYRYRILAENIAQGEFRSDQRVVRGWLHSPGHRKNMLSRDVEEMGVGVGKGKLKGEVVWLAVQVLGRPSLPFPDKAASERSSAAAAGDCVRPNPDLPKRIDLLRTEVSALAAAATGLKTEVEAHWNTLSTKAPRARGYEDSARAYESRVGKYNLLVEEIRRKDRLAGEMVGHYNAEAAKYNACITD
jgi:uncharacterized protein YkwD